MFRRNASITWTNSIKGSKRGTNLSPSRPPAKGWPYYTPARLYERCEYSRAIPLRVAFRSSPASFFIKGYLLTLSMILSLLLASCSNSPAKPPVTTKTASASAVVTVSNATPTATATSTPTSGPAPARYTAHTILQGGGYRPDDLAFDTRGRLLFSDFYSGKISRVNADGTATTILSGIAGPEGIVVLPDGTMIVAEQRTNRVLSFAPGSTTSTVLRQLPGTPSAAHCKDGVDGIALDPTTNTLIVPDSPTGNVYRLSLDGKTLTLLASGIVRPVGADVDAQGIIYIADECGGAAWRIDPNGKTTRIGGFGMLDDVALDGHGNLLVIDLQPSIHALIRMNLATGKRETLASVSYIEPQGLIIDAQGNIFVSDDYADKIVEYQPV